MRLRWSRRARWLRAWPSSTVRWAGRRARRRRLRPRLARDTVSYKEDVLPIFQKRCARCHGAENEDGEVVAEVSLIVINHERLMMGSEFGPVVTAGDPADSWLLEMITEGDMPPEGEGDKVPEEEIAVIRQWIAEGAKNN